MSPRVLENDMINTHVTSPAAIVALGLMYLKTNNAAVAARLALPDTLVRCKPLKQRPEWRCVRLEKPRELTSRRSPLSSHTPTDH